MFIEKIKKLIIDIENNPIENLRISYYKKLNKIIESKKSKKNPNTNEKILFTNLHTLKQKSKIS